MSGGRAQVGRLLGDLWRFATTGEISEDAPVVSGVRDDASGPRALEAPRACAGGGQCAGTGAIRYGEVVIPCPACTPHEAAR